MGRNLSCFRVYWIVSVSDVECAMAPLVAVTVRVVVPVGDLGPELLEQAGITRMLAKTSPSNKRPSSLRLRAVGLRKCELATLRTIPSTPVPRNAENGRCAGDRGCDASIVPSPGTASRAVVLVVIVRVPVAAPDETVMFPPVQLVFAGAPLQVTVTVPVKPFAGVTVIVADPELPRETVSDVGFNAIEKSGGGGALIVSESTADVDPLKFKSPA